MTLQDGETGPVDWTRWLRWRYRLARRIQVWSRRLTDRIDPTIASKRW